MPLSGRVRRMLCGSCCPTLISNSLQRTILIVIKSSRRVSWCSEGQFGGHRLMESLEGAFNLLSHAVGKTGAEHGREEEKEMACCEGKHCRRRSLEMIRFCRPKTRSNVACTAYIPQRTYRTNESKRIMECNERTVPASRLVNLRVYNFIYI